MSSPAALGLTSPRALRSRVLQASSTPKDIHLVLWVLLDPLSKLEVLRVLRVVLRVLPWLHRGYEVLKPQIFRYIWCAMYSRSIWSSPRALG